MNTPVTGLVVALCCVLASPAHAQFGGLLDRAKRRAQEAAEPAREVREIRREAEAAADVERRAEEELARERAELDRVMPNEQRVEALAVDEAERSAAGRALREAQGDAQQIETADERAEADMRARAARSEADARRAVDLETRARGAVERTEAAQSIGAAERDVRDAERDARQVERDVRGINEANERDSAELRSDIDSIERSLQDAVDLSPH